MRGQRPTAALQTPCWRAESARDGSAITRIPYTLEAARLRHKSRNGCRKTARAQGGRSRFAFPARSSLSVASRRPTKPSPERHLSRSEERRVGKGGRLRWAPEIEKK